MPNTKTKPSKKANKKQPVTLDAATGEIIPPILPITPIPSSLSSLPSVNSDSAAAAAIIAAFEAAQAAMLQSNRKIIVCGILLLSQKERLKHGQFLPWLKDHCPNIESRTAQRWMEVTGEMLDFLQIRHDVAFDNLPLHQVLQLDSATLSAEALAIQKRVFDLVDGKSQKQLLLEFREIDSEDLPSGGFKFKPAQLEKWLAKFHPDLAGTPFDSLPRKIQKAFQKHVYSTVARKKIGDESAALLEEAKQDVAEVRSKIDLYILKGDTWVHAEKEDLKQLLNTGEEMNAILRRSIKEK